MAVRHRVLVPTAALALLLPGAPAPAAKPAPPLISVTLTEGAMKVTGSLRQPAGPVRFRLRAVGDGRAMSVFRLKPGHTLAEVVADSDAAADDPRVAAPANLRRLAGKVDFRGGIGLQGGRSATMTLALEPGTYYISDQSDEGDRFEKVTVTSRKGTGVAVRPTAKVTMTEHYRIGGDETLPTTGTIRIRNSASTTDRLYVLSFQRVRPGTTAQDIKNLAGPDADRTVLLPGGFGTDLLSPGRSQLLTYSMPAGTYSLQCMIPGHTGVPHAFNGMVRIVRLK